MRSHSGQSGRLRASFLGRIEDPQSITNLTPTRPDASQDPMVVGRYNVTPQGGIKENPDVPWIWCSHCQKLNHWVGFVLQSNEGQRYLIGGTCGKHHYGGERFSDAKNEFTKEETRIAQIKTLSFAAAQRDEVKNELMSYRKSKNYEHILETRRQLRSALGSNFQILVNVIARGEFIIQEKVISDRGEVNFDSVNLGMLMGESLIKSDLSHYEKKLIELLQHIAQKDVNSFDSSARAKLIRELRDCSRELVECDNRLNRAPAFFFENNISRLNRWLFTLGMSVSIKQDGNFIQIRANGSYVAEIEILKEANLQKLTHTAALLIA